MSRPKRMPFENQMVATPSDWRERMMPSQEKMLTTAKTRTARSWAGLGQASADQPFCRISRASDPALNVRREEEGVDASRVPGCCSV